MWNAQTNVSVAEARRIFAEIAWVLGDRFIMSIVGYGDESYDRMESGGYVIAGWFAHVDDWARFCGHWQNALNEKHAPYLHMKELGTKARGDSESKFHGWSEERVRDFVDRMIPIITGSAIFGITCAIDAARLEEMPALVQRQYQSPYVLAFQAFFEQVIKVLCGETELQHNIPQSEKCSLVFDQVDKEVNLEAHAAFNDWKRLKSDGNRFGTLAFVDSKPEGGIVSHHFLPLQAADLLANRSFKTYKREIDRGVTEAAQGWDMALKAGGNLLSIHVSKKEIEDFANRILRRIELANKKQT